MPKLDAPILEIRQLRKWFVGLHVLNDLDFRVEAGGIRCLIGPNGSGKSTLLKCIAGLYRPDGGEIRLGSERIDGLRPFEIVRRGVSMKFQIVSIYRELTVYQNIRIPVQRRQPHGGERNERIEELLDVTGLAAKRDVPAGILSHGEQQWLEIGMAVGADPRLLILDEPTAGMTPTETRQTADIVHRLNRDHGTAAIVVEHDMAFVRYLDRPVSVLHQGQIFFEGTMEEVRSNADVARIYFGGRR
jgi:ABC-type uncharacterized transport system ATPase subunit